MQRKKKLFCFIFSLIVFLLAGFFSNQIMTLPPSDSSSQASYRLHGPLASTDERLISLVRKRFLHRPSDKPYNFHMNKSDEFSLSYTNFNRASENVRYIYKLLKKLFPPGKNRAKGFFIEAGALDGELISNSLYLELKLGWTGLLIEPDSQMYKLLLSKNRKAWSCNCCLATKPYPHQTMLTILTQPSDHFDTPLSHYRAQNFVEEANLTERIQTGYVSYEQVHCLPLETLLGALNMSKIDFISLDVEGSEVNILREFPWSSITVDVWTVEHTHVKSEGGHEPAQDSDKDFITWFQSKGYSLLEVGPHLPRDYTFIRNGSTLHEKLLTSS